MTKFSEDILGKIKDERICPRPKWCFLLKSSVFWFLLILSMILGSLSFSVIIHFLTYGDLDMLGHLHGNFITSAVMLLPYFWILSLLVFASVAYINWRHTKLGYRFRRRWIFFSSIVVSGFLGSMLYALGMGNEIDVMMARAMPFYDKSKHVARQEIWLRPENGFLVGKIIEVDSVEKIIIIRDEKGRVWSVVEKEIGVTPETFIRKGKIVKIIGTKEGEYEFVAREIRKCGNCQDDEE